MQVLWTLVRDPKAVGKIKTIKEMDKVFGLDLLKKEEIKVPSEIMKMVKDRDVARKEKNWDLADELRDKIENKGWKIDDTGEGSRVVKNN